MHWRLQINIRDWEPTGGDSSNLTVKEAKKIYEEIKSIHKNTMLINSEEKSHAQIDMITRYVAAIISIMAIVFGVLYHINVMRKLLKAGQGYK